MSTRFHKRESKFTPSMFVHALLEAASKSAHWSLSQMSASIHDYIDVSITKQGVDNRFNEESILFMESILKQCLDHQLSTQIMPDLFKEFGRVLIKDSTGFVVPQNLEDHYEGCGGGDGSGKCNAGVRIQYEYDVKTGKTCTLKLTSLSRNDATDAKETKDAIQPGDLVIRDLGYFSSEVLQSFSNQKAYYITRLNTSSKVYDISNDTQPILFKVLYRYMCENNITIYEIPVLVGQSHKLPARMILELVPDEEYEKRIRKNKKRNKKNGWQVSDDYKIRSRFNIIITNVEVDKIATENVYKAYKIRWQVELMFKCWKSTCRINTIKSIKYERFACLLYAKLILIVLNLQLIKNIQAYLYAKYNKLLSEDKCFKTLFHQFSRLWNVLRKQAKESKNEIQKIVELLSKEHWKERKKNKQGYHEITSLFICVSDN